MTMTADQVSRGAFCRVLLHITLTTTGENAVLVDEFRAREGL